ncbi:MAG: MFS transporter [Acidimicrobiales bacterium]
MDTPQLHDRPKQAFRSLLGASAISSFGDGLVSVAFPLLAVVLTHSPLLVSGLLVAGRLPWLVVALPAGVAIDRLDRRRLVAVVEVARALVVGAVALGAATHHLVIAELYVASFCIGAGETVVSSATSGLLPSIVEPEGLDRANGFLGATTTGSENFTGPAAGGIVYSLARFIPFLADAISYVVSAVLLRSVIPASRTVGAESGAPRTRWRSDIWAGLSYLRSSPSLASLTAALASFAFCQAMVVSVLVLYATHDLHLSSTGYGILLAVAASGDVAGSLLTSRVVRRVGPYATLVGTGVLAAGAYLLLGSTTALVVAGAALVIEAAASSVGIVTTRSLRQTLIPRERFGLVNNAIRSCTTGAIPLGALLGGLLGVVIGLQEGFEVAGGLQLAAICALVLPLRAIRSN